MVKKPGKLKYEASHCVHQEMQLDTCRKAFSNCFIGDQEDGFHSLSSMAQGMILLSVFWTHCNNLQPPTLPFDENKCMVMTLDETLLS